MPTPNKEQVKAALDSDIWALHCLAFSWLPTCMASIRPTEVLAALLRHSKGQWGYEAEAAAENEAALVQGGAIFSVHSTPDGRPFWVVTRFDPSGPRSAWSTFIATSSDLDSLQLDSLPPVE